MDVFGFVFGVKQEHSAQGDQQSTHDAETSPKRDCRHGPIEQKDQHQDQEQRSRGRSAEANAKRTGSLRGFAKLIR